MSKIVTFGNLKGGVGKSTMTAFMANRLFLENKDVFVIDCDDRQQTLTDIRQMEIEKGEIPEEEMYPLSSLSAKTVADMIVDNGKEFLEEYDATFIDLPGTLDQEGTKDIYLYSDIIIVLSKLLPNDLLSTFKFQEELLASGFKGEMYFLPYMINPMYSEWIEFNKSKEDAKPDFLVKEEVPMKVIDGFIKYDEKNYGRNINTTELAVNSKGEEDNAALYKTLSDIILK